MVYSTIISYSEKGTATSGLDPEGLFTGGGGGALEAAGLKRAAQAVNGGEYEKGWNPRSLEGGPGDLPRNFLKNLCP